MEVSLKEEEEEGEKKKKWRHSLVSCFPYGIVILVTCLVAVSNPSCSSNGQSFTVLSALSYLVIQ
jgi:hypothetical protein